jgi:DNA-binding GntR family transcriptional regulator
VSTLDEPSEQQIDALEEEDPNHPSEELQTQAEKAYRLILADILRGVLLPTEAEPQSEVALHKRYGRFGIGSRMPIRMALAVLTSEGLIAQRARHGFWVLDYTAHDVRQIAAARSDTDAMVASFLGASISGEGITTEADFQRAAKSLEIIADARRKMESLADHAPQGTVDLDVEIQFATHDTRFHTFMAAASDYMIAARHIRQWRNLLRLYRAQHEIRYTGLELLSICAEHNLLTQLAVRPIQEHFDGNDVEIENRSAMIAQAAAAHATASLIRARVGEEIEEETKESEDTRPGLADIDSEQSHDQTGDARRRADEPSQAENTTAAEYRTRLQEMAQNIRIV